MKVDKSKRKICLLEEICSIRTGKKDANHADDNGCYPFFTCGAIPLKSTTYSFEGANLIVPGNGDIGRCFYYDGKIEAYQRTYVIQLKDNSNIDTKYLYSIFKACWKSYIENKILGAAMPYIKLGHLNSFPIPIYDLDIQLLITSELDAMQAMIDGYKAQIADLDALAQSIFLDMFGDPVTNPKGWEIMKIGEISEVTSSKRIYQSEQTKSGIPFYKISDFPNLIEYGYSDTGIFISQAKYEELKSQKLVPNESDLLITSRGTLGLCYIVKDEDCFYFQDGMITWLKNLKSTVLSAFLGFKFQSSLFKNHIEKAQNGSTIAYLSIAMIRKFDMIVPPIKLQQHFVSQVEAIEKQKELIRDQLAETETLMAERMQYYFS